MRKWYTVETHLIKLAEGISGASPYCVPTSVSFLIGAKMFIPDKLNQSTSTRLKKFRQKLLKKETLAEIKLKTTFESSGVRHKAQHIIPPYIVDFYLYQKKIVIELDGSIHNKARIQQADSRKESFLGSLGLFVFRYKNDTPHHEILQDINSVPDISQEEKEEFCKKIWFLKEIFFQSDLIIERPASFQEILDLNKQVKRLRQIKARFKDTVEAQNCQWLGFQVFGFAQEYAVFYDPISKKRIELNIMGASKNLIKETIKLYRKGIKVQI